MATKKEYERVVEQLADRFEQDRPHLSRQELKAEAEEYLYQSSGVSRQDVEPPRRRK